MHPRLTYFSISLLKLFGFAVVFLMLDMRKHGYFQSVPPSFLVLPAIILGGVTQKTNKALGKGDRAQITAAVGKQKYAFLYRLRLFGFIATLLAIVGFVFVALVPLPKEIAEVLIFSFLLFYVVGWGAGLCGQFGWRNALGDW